MSPRVDRKLYTLYPRKLVHGWVWTYQTYDVAGRRTPQLSTHIGYTDPKDKERTRKQAERKLLEMYKAGKLMPKRLPTLGEWVAERRWWVWGECLYIKGKLLRSSSSRPAISQRTAKDNLAILKARILPYFQDVPLDKITPDRCEAWLFEVAEEGGYKTVNNWRGVFRTMLAEAERLGLIDRNPWDKVPGLKGDPNHYGHLTKAEGQKLLSPDTWREVWNGELVSYLCVLTIYACGLRRGEALAIREEKLQVSVTSEGEQWAIRIDDDWDKTHGGLGMVKNKDVRTVPIPEFMIPLLKQVRKTGFWFSEHGLEPISGYYLMDHYRAALVNIGIPEAQQEGRNIVLHSGRRWLATRLRESGVSDAKINLLTGWATPEMTDVYTDWGAADMSDVRQAQTMALG